MPLSTVEAAFQDIKDGKLVIIVDDAERENEGDLAMAADKVTPEAINFMAKYGRGLICVPMVEQRPRQLGLSMMVQHNTSRFSTAFTVSVDVLKGATTGISSYDRAATVKAMVDPTTDPDDLAKPGHIFPLRYTDGGVLVRAGQTEAVVDLARLAGLYPAGVLCEIMNEDGTMSRMPDLEKFSSQHDIKIVAVADIIAYRRQHEKLVECVAQARLPTEYGDFTAFAYKSIVDFGEHVALVKGEIKPDVPTLVRVHSECLTGDVFHSARCDCGEQVALAMEAISKEGRGILLYMRQEGRGIGLHNKIKAYALQDRGLDTVEANTELGFQPDLRHYGIGAQILVDLGVGKMRLLTNNPRKVVGLESYGLELVERVPIIATENAENQRYLNTKRQKMGHLLDVTESPRKEQ